MTIRHHAARAIVLTILAAGIGSCSYVDDDHLPDDAEFETLPILDLNIDDTERDDIDVDVRDRPNSNKVARRSWVSDDLPGEALFISVLEAAANAEARIGVLSCYDDLYSVTGTTELADGRLASVDISSFTENRPAELVIRVTVGAETENLRERDADPVVEGECPTPVASAFELMAQ